MTLRSVCPRGDQGRHVRLFVMLVVILVLSATVVSAQVTKGSISGSVTDSSGAVVSGAAVKATATATGTVLNTTTDSSGYFRFNLINPGTYTVEISKSGFRTLSQPNISVAAGSDAGLGALKLTVGSTSESVEVTAGTPVLETTQSEVSSTFTQQTMEAIPGVADNQGLDNMALFVPGVSSSRDNSFSNSNGASFSVNGIRGRNNDQQIDGQNNNDNSVAGPAIFLSNQEFVSEYNIVTNNFGPEYGRNAGSVVNVVTKSGTNNLHGSIYGSYNNSVLNALDNAQKLDGTTKQPRSYNEFTGFSLGGPIVKNRVFFFGGFDDQIITSQTQYTTGSWTPTPAGISQLGACYPGSATVAALANYGPFSISAGNPTPTAIAMRSAGTNQVTGNPCSVEMAKIKRTLSTPYHGFDWIGKMDISGSKDTLSFRYLFNRGNSFNSAGSPVTGYMSNVPGLSQAFRSNWTRNLTNRMVNELSLTFSRSNFEFGGNAYGNTVPTTGGIDQAVASISVGSGNLGYGPPNNYPQGRIVNTWQIQDNWNYMVGKHNIKAGINWTYQRSPNVFLPNINSSWSFSGWGNYAANIPSTVTQALGSPNLDFREYDTFLYGGDEWKLTSTFTLNYGLTWTYYGQPANLFHEKDMKNMTGPNPIWNPDLPLSVTTSPLLPSVKNSFAPSVGFAWSPNGKFFGNGKTVFRGGYRRAFDPPFYNIYLNMASAAPQVLLQSFSSTTPVKASSLRLPAVPTGPNIRDYLSPFLQYGVNDPRNYTQTKLSSDFGPDHVDSWSFGIQRELAKDTVVEARYVGNRARNLFQSIDANPYVANVAAVFPNLLPSGVTACTSANAVVPNAVGRQYCDNALVRERTNTGYSDYNGLQVEFRANNLFKQLLLRSSYTWSKTTDNVSEIFGTGGAGTTSAFAQNPWDYTKGEHGLSGLDIPGNWTVSFVEQLPMFKDQKGWVGHLLGGWNISGAYILASGQPYNPIQYGMNYYASGIYGPGGPYGIDLEAYPNLADLPNGVVVDSGFNGSFAGYLDNTRPFLSNRNAPETAVGMTAADACMYFQYDSVCSALNAGSMNRAQLLSLNALNQGDVTSVTSDQVKYIVNAGYSQQLFGTPYGNVGRNSARDFWTNTANAGIIKTTRLNERMKFDFRVTMNNVFNHFNYSSVDTWIDDAGNGGYYNEYGDPKFSDAAGRTITFGARIYW